MDEETNDTGTLESESKLVPCSVCSRTFRPEALERHERICQKTLTKKRKVFDSSKKRAEGTELESLPKSKASELKKSKEKPKPKSNWREKHQEFIQAIRAAKGIPNDNENDVEINGSSKPISVPVGYIQCSSCGRNFSERAADRHISWCKDQKNRVVKSPVSNDASERLKARTKYRAPLPVKKGSSAKSENVGTGTKPTRTPLQDQQKSQPKPVLSDATGQRNVFPQQRQKKVAKPPQKPKPRPDNNAKKNIVKKSEVSRRTAVKSDIAAPVSSRNIMKFKEKFPNHVHRTLIVDENDDEFRQDLRDLLRNNTVFSKAPRTVPGVRTGGQMSTSDFSNRNLYKNSGIGNSENSDSLALQDRMKELGFDIGWAKKLSNWDTKVPDNMPQIGSSDNTFEVNNNDPWAPISAGETRVSTGNSSSGSDSTLPPISRGSSGSDMGNRLPRFCHQCGTKYPVTVAKYCCECGARRVANAAVVT